MSAPAAERAYIRRIERKFVTLREGGLLLSPRDFGLLLDWYHRGVPAELVIDAIETVVHKREARTSGKRVQSIAYCRHAVEDAWEERRAVLTGAPVPSSVPSAGAFTPDEVGGHLERSAGALLAAAAAASSRLGHTGRSGTASSAGDPDAELAAPLETIAARLLELREALLREPPKSFERTEGELVRLEASSLEAARSILPPHEIEEIAREAESRIEPFTSRMSEKARSATAQRAIAAAIRERLGLPRLSLFTIVR